MRQRERWNGQECGGEGKVVETGAPNEGAEEMHDMRAAGRAGVEDRDDRRVVAGEQNMVLGPPVSP